MTNKDKRLVVNARGVLRNDLRTQCMTSLNLVSPTRNGSVDLQEDGSFVYIPNAGFAGLDTFEYELYQQGGFTSLATVTITVSGTKYEIAEGDMYGYKPDTLLQVRRR